MLRDTISTSSAQSARVFPSTEYSSQARSLFNLCAALVRFLPLLQYVTPFVLLSIAFPILKCIIIVAVRPDLMYKTRHFMSLPIGHLP
jgi:hypothetical protein